jgi:hypothetical protein
MFTAGALAVIRYAKIYGTKHRPWLTALLARRNRQKIFNGLHLKSWTLGFVIDGKINANPETGTPNIFRRE